MIHQSPAQMLPSSNMGFPALPVLPSLPLGGSARGGGLNGTLSRGLPSANGYQVPYFNAADSYSNPLPLSDSHAPLASTSSAPADNLIGTLATALHPLPQNLHISYAERQPTSSSTKPFQCPTPGCNKSYKGRSGLKNHQMNGKCQGKKNVQVEQAQPHSASVRYSPYNFETRA